MRVRFLVVIALICGVAIAGCSRAPEPVPLPAPAVPAPVPIEDGLAPFYAQTIEWRDCGDAECEGGREKCARGAPERHSASSDSPFRAMVDLVDGLDGPRGVVRAGEPRSILRVRGSS